MAKYKISFGIDDGCFEKIETAVSSILSSAKEDDSFSFVFLDNGLSYENRSKLLELKEIKDFEFAFNDGLKKSVESNGLFETKEEKELLHKVLKANSDNMRTFFEEAIKFQIDTLHKHYENISIEQKLSHEKLLAEKLLSSEDVFQAKLNEQVANYQKELENYKYSVVLNTKTEMDNTAKWYLDNIKQELDEQRNLFEIKIKELMAKNAELEEALKNAKTE